MRMEANNVINSIKLVVIRKLKMQMPVGSVSPGILVHYGGNIDFCGVNGEQSGSS